MCNFYLQEMIDRKEANAANEVIEGIEKDVEAVVNINQPFV